MLKMTEKTKTFLAENLPEALTAENIGDALKMLYELIDRKGFAPPSYEEYNDFGRTAQKVYDDLYYSN